MKKTALVSLLFASSVSATGMSIPSANVPSGYDRVTTTDGFTCESTIASDTYVQTGLIGTQQDSDYSPKAGKYSSNLSQRDEIGAYVQLVIPIGAKRERINCNRLYNLEISRLQAQIKQMELEASLGDIWNELEETPVPVVSSEPDPEPVLKKETITIDSQRGSAVFEKGSDRLRFSRLNEFDKALGTLNEYPQSKVTVIGHTDSSGSKEYNKRLSEKRAESVAEYFVSQGIDKNRISFEGYGEEHPIESNDTEEGRERNRRVEVVIESFTIEQ